LNIGFHSIWAKENEYFFDKEYNKKHHFGNNLWLPMVKLKEYAEEHGVTIGSVANFKVSEIDIFVFHEVPDQLDQYYCYAIQNEKPMFLYNYEPEVVYPRSHDLSLHAPFIKVFTQHDKYLTIGPKYIKINPFCLDVCQPVRNTEKDKLCVMISSDKNSDHPLALYSKRVEAINWFEANHPDSFDFYGHWDSSSHPCHRGIIENKIETLSRYRFAICYENSKDISGYITEKILDCFIAGCIPVYWGAPNISDYIPTDCYIDRKKFQSYEQLYSFMSDMNDEDYLQYLNTIDEFIQSPSSKQFSIKHYIDTMWTAFEE